MEVDTFCTITCWVCFKKSLLPESPRLCGQTRTTSFDSRGHGGLSEVKMTCSGSHKHLMAGPRLDPSPLRALAHGLCHCFSTMFCLGFYNPAKRIVLISALSS
jgi:hypothetical protein